MFRRPGTGRSKATVDTLCQKCLTRGHYSYECTVSAQQRPYKPRPSRTQQLLNPQLKPKLTTEVPNDLLRKKGIADEILAKKEQERGRKSKRDRRSRSVSSHSYDSVSTISTNRSRSRSPPPKRIENEKPSSRGGDMLGKRGRRAVSSESEKSFTKAERHTRRRLSSFSPDQRGRRKSRSKPNGKRPARNLSISRSPSMSPNRMDMSDDHYEARTAARPVSPAPRGRWEASPEGRRLSPSRSRSRSPYPRASPGPHVQRRATRSPSPNENRNGGRRNQFDDRPPPPVQPLPPRERSLSPYSKRVALTRQIQPGR
jgi:hypothetical protein